MAIPILNKVDLGFLSLYKPLIFAHTHINSVLTISGADNIFHSLNKEVISRYAIAGKVIGLLHQPLIIGHFIKGNGLGIQ